MQPRLAAPERRPELDWLRVVAILLLHLFHTGMMFNTWDWHLKSPTRLPVLEPPMVFLHLTRMPLLMLISGVGTAFALRRRGIATFAWDRTRRLLWPLVFGMFVIVPPQIYAERLSRGQFQGSYLDFYPSVFQFVPYPRGSFSWHHLWFVAYLFVYCLLALPLFRALRTERGTALAARFDAWLARGANLWALFVPLAAGRTLLFHFPETHALVNDPNTFVYYGLLFLIGHQLGRGERVWARLAQLRRWHLAAALALSLTVVFREPIPYPLDPIGPYAFVWSSLLAILGYARAHVTQRKPWLARAQELAYPFYIFHQTVIVLVGFALLKLPVGPWSLLALVLAGSFIATWALCEGVSRVSWLRPCFGMAPRRARRPDSATAPAPGHTGRASANAS